MDVPTMEEVCAVLMRHADYEQPQGVPSAWLPHPLTERGFEQARRVAPDLLEFCASQGRELDHRIDSSALLRAWQTATEIARGLGAGYRVVETAELAERGVGAAANLSVAEIEAVLAKDPRFEVPAPGWKSSGDYRLPLLGAESLRDAGLRVASYVQRSCAEMQASGRGARVRLFVGHGAAIRWAAVALGALEETRVPGLSMHHCGWVALQRRGASWSQIGGAWKLRSSGEAVTD